MFFFLKKTFFSILKWCSLSALSTQADYCSLLHSPVLYALLFIFYLLLSRDSTPSIFYFFPPFTSLFLWSWQEKRRQSWGCSSGISFAWHQEYINTEHNRKKISREIGHVQALIEFRFIVFALCRLYTFCVVFVCMLDTLSICDKHHNFYILMVIVKYYFNHRYRYHNFCDA